MPIHIMVVEYESQEKYIVMALQKYFSEIHPEPDYQFISTVHHQALDIINDYDFRMIIMDLHGSDIEAEENDLLCKNLRSASTVQPIYILGLRYGNQPPNWTDDSITFPISIDEIEIRVKKLTA